MSSEVKEDPAVTAAPRDIYAAAEAGDVEMVRELIANDEWDYGRTDSKGRLPLTCAALGGNPEIIRIMIENGANPNAQSPLGTPLQIVRQGGKTEAEAVLVALGATE